MIKFRTAGLVPGAFVYALHAPCMASDSPVREEIRRICKYHVESTVWIIAGNCVKEFKTVPLVDPDTTTVIAVRQSRRWGWRGATECSGDAVPGVECFAGSVRV